MISKPYKKIAVQKWTAIIKINFMDEIIKI